MKKSYLLVAAAALAMASCTNDELNVGGVPQTGQLPEGGVGFDAYAQRGVTRAGQAGVMALDKLKLAPNKTTQQGGGFGVFGYYTDNNDYEQSRVPDFMYNQLVEWDETGNYWKYEPIKYWPNEYGSNAESDDADKVTFFAYAPYVYTNGSGKIDRQQGDDLASYGITGMSRNSQAGDPIVKYIASFEADKSVDLLWGVVGTTEAAADYWSLTNTGAQTFQEGYPWMNVMRPAEAKTQQAAQQRVKFTFAHALTQLSLNVDAIVDEINKGSNELAAGTKIYVRQLSMTGVALKGALNLNNSENGAGKALWMDYNGLGDIESGVPVVLYDGRKDGKEGVKGATASNEKTVGFNPDIISNDENSSAGVTATTKQVFASDPVMLIPTGENMELEIVYDVETADDHLATLLSDGKTHGSSIENKIRKTIDLAANGLTNGLENGKHYTINLHLGMNSVKFDVAAVTGWLDDNTQINVDLPSNNGGTVAGASAVKDASLDDFDPFTGLTYEAQTYTFTVTGLTGNEAVTAYLASSTYVDALRTTSAATVQVGSASDYTGTDNKADANGNAYVKVTLPGNPYVHALPATSNYILVEGQESLKGWKARFVQAAHPFGLQVTGLANNTTTDEITLAANATGVDAAALTLNTISETAKSAGAPTGQEANFVKVSVNGTDLTYSATPTANQYSYDGANKKITIGQNLAVGDKVAITVAALDASNNEDGAKEKVEFTVGGISYAPTYVQNLVARTATYDVTEPQIVGVPGTITYTLNSAVTGSEMAIAGTAITANKELAETVAVDATAAEGTETAGGEYFYTATSCAASYKVAIAKQTTSMAWSKSTEVITDIATDATSVAFTSAATLTAAQGDDMSAKTITYTVVSATANGVDQSAKFTAATAGSLTVTGLEAAKNYLVTVKASFAGDDGYTASEETFQLTVQTVGF